MAAIQVVRVLGHEERSTPKTHIVYKIQVQASVRTWLMWRRYSEFDDLNTELTKSIGEAPPCPLPPKHSFTMFRSKENPQVLQERVEGLEAYLRAIVASKDDRWRVDPAFKEFLGIPAGRKDAEGSSRTDFTSASWLDEHMDLQNHIRDIRADVNKRDALLERGDVSSAHSTNVQARKKLAQVLTRLTSLTDGLTNLANSGLSEGEVRRRTDMVARLQDDCEKLSKMMVAVRTTGTRALTTNVSSNKVMASDRDREVLFSQSSQSSKPFARVFGAVGVPEETEETRPLDDQSLLQLQQTKIDQQDEQLNKLTVILARQRQLGLAINQEIAEQNDLLDGLTEDVDRTGAKLSNAKKQLNRIDNR